MKKKMEFIWTIDTDDAIYEGKYMIYLNYSISFDGQTDGYFEDIKG